MIQHQKTLSVPVTFSGIGIHTGKSATVILKPAPVDYGIRFTLDGQRTTPATISFVSRYANFSTELLVSGESISTIEHLMAALYFAGITNCLVDIDGPEIPVLDGSAWDILKLIYNQDFLDNTHYVPKIVTQMAIVKPFLITEEIAVDGPNGERVSLAPAEEFSAEIMIDFSERSPNLIGKQSFKFVPADATSRVWAQCSIACARTFGFYSDMETMHKWQRGMGAGLENCIVVDDTTDELMNDFDLYWPDEFVRHKMVDVLGDLMLAGQPIQGKFVGYKPSHKLVHELLRKVYNVYPTETLL